MAELIDREVAVRCSPGATFEQREEIAAAVAAELIASFARGAKEEG
jgi:hypothetical protein